MENTTKSLEPSEVRTASGGKSKLELPTTQRAYTLRLRRAPGKCATCGKDDCACWRDALWATHEAVNKGAKVFGDWLLTLRGGLCHTLANARVAQGKGKPERDPKPEERRDRRILLALSWLSVESAPRDGDPHGDFVVASGKEHKSARTEKVLAAFRRILQTRGVTGSDLDGWIADCEPSLSAAIRNDAVWVNRSAHFDAARAQIGRSLTRDEIWDFLEPFFGSRATYLAPISSTDSDDDAPAEEDEPKDLVQKAGHWLSLRGGKDEGADFSAIATRYANLAQAVHECTPGGSGADLIRVLCGALNLNDASVEGVFRAVSYTGSKRKGRFFTVVADLAEKPILGHTDLSDLSQAIADANVRFKEATERRERNPKGPRPYADTILAKVASACGFPYAPATAASNHRQYGVMLDHAARRVSITHTWVKRAESERQKSKADAAKMDEIPAAAKAWLDQFCEDRSTSSGAVDAYRIRRRAIGGWKEVVTKWNSSSCKTPENRVAAARELQADPPEIDKFGDIQLFEALAADDAVAVWRANGEASPQPLLDYAIAADAIARQKRFKVPAYRHPDPLSHPVFCDFGNSRWEIRFAVHDAASELCNAKATASRREKVLHTASERLTKAAPEKKAEATSKLEQAENDLKAARGQVTWLESRHAVSMGLWDGEKLADGTPLCWSCKRLTNDLDLQNRSAHDSAINVTRADRLGRAVANVDRKSPVNIRGLFDLPDWNGRLQAPRQQLDEIAKRVQKRGWDAKAKRMRGQIRWLVSFSAKLQPEGPWMNYLEKFPEDALAKPFVSRKGEYAIKHRANDGRSGHAKLVLSRLPGLRVLSVDLGHRFAAACAVWETLSSPVLTSEIAGRTVIAGGTGREDMYLHTRNTDSDGRSRTTIYRRVGADTLHDGTPHPAPWARLDRQFLIKLPGEEKPARRASDAELARVGHVEAELGRHRSNEDPLPRQVNELMAETMRTLRLALRRLGDAARIAYAFMPGANDHTPGGGTKDHTPETRKAAVLDALVRWNELRGGWPGARWTDPIATRNWEEYIGPRLSADLPVLGEDATTQDRKKHRNELEKCLDAIASEFAGHGESGTPSLYKLWEARWDEDSDAWKRRLKWVRKWLLPIGLRSQRGDATEMAGERKARRDPARNVGGLSLGRITTIRELYQVQKAYHYRPHPNDPRAGVTLTEDEATKGWKFGDRALQAMERMRDQRVKQLASRIAGSALGLGGHWRRVDTKRIKADGTTRKKWVWVEDPIVKYAPCHAVVIENLTNYRPEETRTRRENRQLMSWSSSKVKKYLSEACQLHGLHLREVQAGYTSRQDSRTGAPGVRCADVPLADFIAKPWWRRQVKLAVEKGDKGDARERLLAMIEAQCSSLSDSERRTAPAIRIPVSGGELFVSADPRSPAAKGLQADLNAAANIGLKALLDPDFTGKWWFIPCQSANHTPDADKTKGSLVIPIGQPLLPVAAIDAEASDPKAGSKRGRAKSVKKEREIVNLWRDISASPIDNGSRWRSTPEYWNGVRCRVIEHLERALKAHPSPNLRRAHFPVHKT